MTRVAIAGAAGRMGQMLVEMVHASSSLSLGAALEHPASPLLGQDAGVPAGVGETGIEMVSEIGPVADSFDVLIDFTVPDATLASVSACRDAGKRMVIGTTGLNDTQFIRDAAQDVGIVFAPNMSIGVNLCFKLLQTAAEVLGDAVDVEIVEAHHRHKVDAPSGTAVRMGEILADALQRDLSTCAVYGRQGQTGERDRREIAFHSIRAGDNVGEHTVMFAADGECVEITHRALSRKTFAGGALRAAQWIADRPRGLFDMQDVLGLR